MNKTLPEGVHIKLVQWLSEEPVILHFWEMEGTYFIVARTSTTKSNLIYYLRVFKIGDVWMLSQDAKEPYIF